MKAQCNKCRNWFTITKELQNLIEEGFIHPLEVNLCPECAEIEQERAEYEHELLCICNEF